MIALCWLILGCAVPLGQQRDGLARAHGPLGVHSSRHLAPELGRGSRPRQRRRHPHLHLLLQVRNACLLLLLCHKYLQCSFKKKFSF